ncbi:MAG: M48 family metallopeptidase [Oscillospiraceae bacterium]|nr:M48 family metallopeptidase [Oscillospiraceae bacterium]
MCPAKRCGCGVGLTPCRYRAARKTLWRFKETQWEGITGLRCAEWRIKNMKTRWGSCNTRARRIWLNLQLVKRPPECLAYVILHELIHLVEHNHGPRFYAQVARYMPDWRVCKQRLDERPPGWA